MKVIESNCQTGEVTERDMTPAEIAAVQSMAQAAEAARIALEGASSANTGVPA